MSSYFYRLPWPPSVNCYIRRGNNRSYMTKRGKTFRDEVKGICFYHPYTLIGRVKVLVELTLPDRRKRDIDNHIKATLDALQHAGVFGDDEQIDELIVRRMHVEPPGCCDVTVSEIEA